MPSRSQTWRARNLTRVRAAEMDYRKARREIIRAQHLAWRKRNPEKVRARTAAWQLANPTAVAANNARRLARKANAPGRGVTAGEWRRVLADSFGICAYCNQPQTLEMDHVEPLSADGEHDIENITASCVSCNRSKMDTPLLLWLAKSAPLRNAA